MGSEIISKTGQIFKQIKDASNPSGAKNIRKTVFSSGSGLSLSDDWSLNQYVWYPWYNSLKKQDLYARLQELNIPKLEVFEFQPATDLAMYVNLLIRSIEVAKRVGTGEGGLTEMLSRLQSKVGSALQGIVNPTSEGAILENFNSGNAFYNRISDGKYVSRFELPCYNDLIWGANGGQGWKRMGAVERYLGAIGSGLFSKVGVDVPSKPEFEASNTPVPNVNTKFYLFNGHVTAAEANLKLLYSLLPGGYWMQDAYYQRGSNLYTVRYENYYQYQLCTMDAKISMKGKSRKPPDRITQTFKSITMLPDIFEVDITFTSVLPDTLNQFLAPYFSEFQSIQVGTTTTGGGIFDDILNDVAAEPIVGPPAPPAR